MAHKKHKETPVEAPPASTLPIWAWWLLFLLPLIASEYMFSVGGRGWSMIVFPLAWIGFWYTTMDRAGWPILPARWREKLIHPTDEEEGGPS